MRIDKPEVIKDVVFSAISSADASNNSIFLDSNDNILKTKNDNGDVNSIGKSIELVEVYNGTDLNCSRGDTRVHEFNNITSSKLEGHNYIKITTTYTAWVDVEITGDGGSRNSNVTYKIETKNIGGNYSDSLSSQSLLYNDTYSPDTFSFQQRITNTITHYHELTNDEKNNGVIVKITTSATGDYNTSYTNIQTIIELI